MMKFLQTRHQCSVFCQSVKFSLSADCSPLLADPSLKEIFDHFVNNGKHRHTHIHTKKEREREREREREKEREIMNEKT